MNQANVSSAARSSEGSSQTHPCEPNESRNNAQGSDRSVLSPHSPHCVPGPSSARCAPASIPYSVTLINGGAMEQEKFYSPSSSTIPVTSSLYLLNQEERNPLSGPSCSANLVASVSSHVEGWGSGPRVWPYQTQPPTQGWFVPQWQVGYPVCQRQVYDYSCSQPAAMQHGWHWGWLHPGAWSSASLNAPQPSVLPAVPSHMSLINAVPLSHTHQHSNGQGQQLNDVSLEHLREGSVQSLRDHRSRSRSRSQSSLSGRSYSHSRSRSRDSSSSNSSSFSNSSCDSSEKDEHQPTKPTLVDACVQTSEVFMLVHTCGVDVSVQTCHVEEASNVLSEPLSETHVSGSLSIPLSNSLEPNKKNGYTPGVGEEDETGDIDSPPLWDDGEDFYDDYPRYPTSSRLPPYFEDMGFQTVLSLIRDTNNLPKPKMVAPKFIRSALSKVLGYDKIRLPSSCLPQSRLLKDIFEKANASLRNLDGDENAFLPQFKSYRQHYYTTSDPFCKAPWFIPEAVASLTFDSLRDLKKLPLTLPPDQVSSLETVLSKFCEAFSWLDWWIDTCDQRFVDQIPPDQRSLFKKFLLYGGRCIEYLSRHSVTALTNLMLAHRDAVLDRAQPVVPPTEISRLRHSPISPNSFLFPLDLVDEIVATSQPAIDEAKNLAEAKRYAAAYDALLQRCAILTRNPKVSSSMGQASTMSASGGSSNVKVKIPFKPPSKNWHPVASASSSTPGKKLKCNPSF